MGTIPNELMRLFQSLYGNNLISIKATYNIYIDNQFSWFTEIIVISDFKIDTL